MVKRIANNAKKSKVGRSAINGMNISLALSFQSGLVNWALM